MDKPASPAGEAKQAFYNRLFNRSLEQRMAFRERVLSTSILDLKNAAELYFTDKPCSIGIISNKDTVEESGLEDIEILNL